MYIIANSFLPHSLPLSGPSQPPSTAPPGSTLPPGETSAPPGSVGTSISTEG